MRATARVAWLRRVLGGVPLVVLALPGLAAAGPGFVARANGTVNPHEVLGIDVASGGKLGIEVPAAEHELFTLEAPSGLLQPDHPGHWTWKAPRSAGLFPLVVRRHSDGATMTFNVFVLAPAAGILEGNLNGYTIGSYPRRPPGGLPNDPPPQGFIEVTPENVDTRISPHFTLGQFLCKQDGEYPKYVVLEERLMLFLEILLREVNEHGWKCETLHVMSGYRTPSYNAAIENVPYSRHLWGGAADVFIDADPEDGRMDDLNADGVVDKNDADALYDFVEHLLEREGLASFVGGLGSYGATDRHGPFVHVDVRGRRARWGRESN